MGKNTEELKEQKAPKPKKAEKPPEDPAEAAAKKRVLKEVAGVFFVAFTLLTVGALVSYDYSDLNEFSGDSRDLNNFGGITGAYLSWILIRLFGAGSWAVPVITLAIGVMMFKKDTWKHVSSLLAGGAFFLLAASILLNVFWVHDPSFPDTPVGGYLGKFLAGNILIAVLAKPGAAIIGITVLLVAVLVGTRLTVWEFLKAVKRGMDTSGDMLKAAWHKAFQGMRQAQQAREERRAAQQQEEEDKPLISGLGDKTFSGGPAPGDEEEEAGPGEKPQIIKKKAAKDGAPQMNEEFKAEQKTFTFLDNGQEYIPPSLSLLVDPQAPSKESTEQELLVNSQILTKKLADFGIEGRVTMVLPGPVITLYEFEPAAGVKVSRIVNLADDLAMGLRAVSVRILAPVPGKAVVGIEVPNRSREPVSLKKILSSGEFKNTRVNLPLALGKDTGGVPVVTDLATIPHLLIAGATGSGKSVGLNAMIMSILYKHSPAEVKFIMIDPKMLELSVYDGIPHLIAPVVTNPKKAANALRWAVTEMERRYQLLADLGFRNIGGYNKWVREFLEEREEEKKKKGIRPEELEDGEEDEEELKPLPFIVVIIDELADLMMVASKDVEDAMARLAQMARAAGIHLIVATQRPSVDVLTGTIKANFPARISYQVTSRVDSRTILDTSGAEKLLGSGDMLFVPPGTSRLQRIHGPFVSDDEVKRTADFLRKQGKPVYNEEILKMRAMDDTPDNLDADDDDEFFEQAVELVANTRQASISMIQRRLRIGYNRAARIIETMEAKGMVGPADGAKPRQVLIPPVAEGE